MRLNRSRNILYRKQKEKFLQNHPDEEFTTQPPLIRNSNIHVISNWSNKSIEQITRETLDFAFQNKLKIIGVTSFSREDNDILIKEIQKWEHPYPKKINIFFLNSIDYEDIHSRFRIEQDKRLLKRKKDYLHYLNIEFPDDQEIAIEPPKPKINPYFDQFLLNKKDKDP
ncbi:MAG: hypothetical protein ACTSRK_19990 [Promethearchaeota archaeon]